MANPLPPQVSTGTIGELLVQLRLLELGVQAVQPHKDSGNDFIACRGKVAKFIQVKTSMNRTPRVNRLPALCDYVFLVTLKKDGKFYLHDESVIKVIDELGTDLGELNADLVNRIWPQ